MRIDYYMECEKINFRKKFVGVHGFNLILSIYFLSSFIVFGYLVIMQDGGLGTISIRARDS